MRTDEAKKYLNRYQNYKGSYRRAKKVLEELWNEIGASGINYDGMPHGTMPFSRTEEDAIEMGQKAQEVRRLYTHAKLAMAEIELVIEEIDNESIRQALWLKYINGYKCELVSDKMGYTERHVRRLVHLGEEHVQIKLFPETISK